MAVEMEVAQKVIKAEIRANKPMGMAMRRE